MRKPVAIEPHVNAATGTVYSTGGCMHLGERLLRPRLLLVNVMSHCSLRAACIIQ